MGRFRRIVRDLYSRLFVSAMHAVASNTRELCAKSLRAQLGGNDTLHVVAPGASVSRKDSLGGAQVEGDVLGVNYFIACTDVPLWEEVRMFVIEPHETYSAYVEALANAIKAKRSCIVLVKGTGSPAKFTASARLVRALAAIAGVTVLLARDTYVSDLARLRYAEAIVGSPSRTVSGFKTLLWTLSFAFVAGYRHIVLHGFDFSHDYAYRDSRAEEAVSLQPNTWVFDDRHRSSILDEVARLERMFTERGVRLAQCGCDGPLAEVLPAYVSAETCGAER